MSQSDATQLGGSPEAAFVGLRRSKCEHADSRRETGSGQSFRDQQLHEKRSSQVCIPQHSCEEIGDHMKTRIKSERSPGRLGNQRSAVHCITYGVTTGLATLLVGGRITANASVQCRCKDGLFGRVSWRLRATL